MNEDGIGKRLLGLTLTEYTDDLVPSDIYSLPRKERRKTLGKLTLQYHALLEEAQHRIIEGQTKEWESLHGIKHTGIPEYRKKTTEPSFMQILIEDKSKA